MNKKHLINACFTVILLWFGGATNAFSASMMCTGNQCSSGGPGGTKGCSSGMCGYNGEQGPGRPGPGGGAGGGPGGGGCALGGVCNMPAQGRGGGGGNAGGKSQSDISSCFAEKIAEKVGEAVVDKLCGKFGGKDCEEINDALGLMKSSRDCLSSCANFKDNWNLDACTDILCDTIGNKHPALKAVCTGKGWAEIARDCFLIPVVTETVTMACEIGHAIEHGRDPVPPTACVGQASDANIGKQHKLNKCMKCCMRNSGAGADGARCENDCRNAFQ